IHSGARKASFGLWWHCGLYRFWCPKSSSDDRPGWFDTQLRMCRKMRSEPAEGVVQAGFDRSDRTVNDLSDLRQVQPVHVVQHDHEPVLGPELVNRAKDKLAKLGLLRDVRGRPLLVGERFVDRLIEGRQDQAFTRAAVVRKVDRYPFQPGPKRIVRLEARQGAMGPRERVHDDLFRG